MIVNGNPNWLGETQVDLLREAAGKTSGQLMIDPVTDNKRWCAMKRLVKRGLFACHRFGANSIYGRTTVYEITSDGRERARTL